MDNLRDLAKKGNPGRGFRSFVLCGGDSKNSTLFYGNLLFLLKFRVEWIQHRYLHPPCWQSTVNFQPATFNRQLSTGNFQLVNF